MCDLKSLIRSEPVRVRVISLIRSELVVWCVAGGQSTILSGTPWVTPIQDAEWVGAVTQGGVGRPLTRLPFLPWAFLVVPVRQESLPADGNHVSRFCWLLYCGTRQTLPQPERISL